MTFLKTRFLPVLALLVAAGWLVHVDVQRLHDARSPVDPATWGYSVLVLIAVFFPRLNQLLIVSRPEGEPLDGWRMFFRFALSGTLMFALWMIWSRLNLPQLSPRDASLVWGSAWIVTLSAVGFRGEPGEPRWVPCLVISALVVQSCVTVAALRIAGAPDAAWLFADFALIALSLTVWNVVRRARSQPAPVRGRDLTAS